MDQYGLLSGTLGLVILFFLIVLAILWLLVPFAIFGIKGLLRDLIQEQRRTNALLSGMVGPTATQVEAEADRPTLKNILAEVRKP